MSDGSVAEDEAPLLTQEQLAAKLPQAKIFEVVENAAKGGPTLSRFVLHNRDRVRMLADSAGAASAMGYRGRVRQKTGLSSFCTLDVRRSHAYRKLRYCNPVPDKQYVDLIRQERNELAKHVAEAGCRLIINPGKDYRKYCCTSKFARLAGLIQFLKNPPGSDVQAVISDEEATGDSLTVVGDWFSATSVPIRLGDGYRQTVFCMNALSATELARSFDDEFEELLDYQDLRPEESREYTIAQLEAFKATEEDTVRTCCSTRDSGTESCDACANHGGGTCRRQGVADLLDQLNAELAR